MTNIDKEREREREREREIILVVGKILRSIYYILVNNNKEWRKEEAIFLVQEK